jgi:hypothetical protein
MLRFAVSTGLVIGFALCFSGVARAEDGKRLELVSATGQGFYYDSRTNRYFSDGKSSFIIRPVEDPKYLEKIELSLDEGDFQTYSGKMKFDQEGFHLVRFRASDPVLNWSPLQEFRIYVDLTPPKSFAFWHGPSFEKDSLTYVGPQSVLQIAAQDTVSGVSQIIWDEGGKSGAFPGQVRFKTEGEHVIHFFAVDNVGNREPVQELKFVVVAKPPTTKADIHGQTYKTDAGLYVNSGSEILLSGQDAGSPIKAIEYQINGGLVTEYHHPIPVIEKKLELRYHGVDGVGNQEPWKTLTVFQDTMPPMIAVEKIGTHMTSGGRIYATPGFALNVTARDDETGLKEIMISRDGKSFDKAPGGKIVFDQPGEYHFFAKASDRVGNTVEANPYTVIIDNQPPKTMVKTNDKLVQKDGVFVSAIPNQLEFIATDDGVGVDRTEVSYDGKTWVSAGRAIEITQWSQSKRTVYFRSIDRLGNREAVQSMTIVLRTEGPKVDLFVEQGDLPEVPLSQLKNSRYSVQRQRSMEPELQEGPPAPRAPAGSARGFTGPPSPGSEQGGDQ